MMYVPCIGPTSCIRGYLLVCFEMYLECDERRTYFQQHRRDLVVLKCIENITKQGDMLKVERPEDS